MEETTPETLQDTIEKIVERVQFTKKDKVLQFLRRCILKSPDTAKTTYSIHENVLFKAALFFDGLKVLSAELPTDQKLIVGVETLNIVLEELGFDIDKEDAFIFFQLRDLGKFKIKDQKLFEQMKGLWGTHKEYALEDRQFSKSLKELMRMGLIDLRKGNLALKQNIVITYKND